MWHFDSLGFVSIVAYDPKKDKKKDSPFPEIVKTADDAPYADTHLLVRARIKEDLDMLKTVEPTLVIDTDPAADYSFRCVVRRTKFKKFLADSVDRIDYDSHFKEVAEARSPKVNGRHSAMMKCWSAMADLQPFSPYGGYGGYYGDASLWNSGGYYSGSSSKKSGTGGGTGKAGSGTGSKGVVKGSTAAYGLEGTDKDKRGYETVADYIEAYIESEGQMEFHLGDGPRTGFQKGDKVIGYAGEGEVESVFTNRSEGIDLVRVRNTKTKTTSNFLSTYLTPLDLPEIPEDSISDDLEDDEGLWTVDDLYTWFKTNDFNPAHFPPEWIGALDNTAWELLTTVQEFLGREQTTISVEDLDRIYDEIMWEAASDKEKLALIADDKVPEKYTEDALRLPIFSDS